MDALLARSARLIHRRSLLIVVSDFLAPLDALESALHRLRFDGHDVVAVQVLDGEEIEFPFLEGALFEDPETGDRREVEPRRARARYLRALRAIPGGAVGPLPPLGISTPWSAPTPIPAEPWPHCWSDDRRPDGLPESPALGRAPRRCVSDLAAPARPTRRAGDPSSHAPLPRRRARAGEPARPDPESAAAARSSARAAGRRRGVRAPLDRRRRPHRADREPRARARQHAEPSGGRRLPARSRPHRGAARRVERKRRARGRRGGGGLPRDRPLRRRPRGRGAAGSRDRAFR